MNEEHTSKPSPGRIQFNWNSAEGDKTADGLKGGLEAFGKVLEGIVKMAQGIGSEALRNQSAMQWLDQIAASLEATVKTARETGKYPDGKSGEMACYLERLNEELAGTKYESQASAFRERLQQVCRSLDQLERTEQAAAAEEFAKELKQLSNIAGYFRGAAGPKST